VRSTALGAFERRSTVERRSAVERRLSHPAICGRVSSLPGCAVTFCCGRTYVLRSNVVRSNARPAFERTQSNFLPINKTLGHLVEREV
jgi:hypothetical protein